MAKKSAKKTPSKPDPAHATLRQRLTDWLLLIHHWVADSPIRMALTTSLALITVGTTFAVWSYLAHLAVESANPVTLKMALAALDAHDTDEAKNLIGKLQQQPNDVESLGGALFVLGAAKEFDAMKEWSVDRRRAMHLVASRYLQKAQLLGIPPKRESQLLFLLGRSLVLGNQPQAGIPVLEEALLSKESWAPEIHSLLANAYLLIPDPDLKAALKHNEVFLSQPTWTPEVRAQAYLSQAEILQKLGRPKQSRQALKNIHDTKRYPARIKMLLGQLALNEATHMKTGSPARSEQLTTALADIRDAQRLDQRHGALSRRAMYWIGKCYEAQGNPFAAVEQYDRIRKLYGDTPEGLAAILAEADLDRAAGRTEKAFAGYRTVLETVGDPLTYSNILLPLGTLRKRLLESYRDYISKQEFDHALTMVDLFEPVISKSAVIELRAQTDHMWAEHKLDESTSGHPWQEEAPAREGRLHYRAAGRAYEDVARLRYTTREFPDDLWQAAENYYLGHNYTHAIRVLDEYLHQEAHRRNALALLRLGQSHLALEHFTQAIHLLNDCIDMHPRDSVIFQARLECARAYRDHDQAKLAEHLLRINLTGDTMGPTAPEWQKSLFLLGHLLYDEGRYHEAIGRLEEAVERYPQAPDTMLARYLIARAFHSATVEPRKKMETAKTENERQKNRKLYTRFLNEALRNYQAVGRAIALDGHHGSTPMNRNLLRNSYMMQGSVFFQLRQYEKARKAYANVTTLFQDEPFVLESFVQIANCWQRLNEPVKARGTIEQAKLVLGRMPANTDFKLATNLNRQGWKLLLDQIGKW